jgi:hypothetical protein
MTGGTEPTTRTPPDSCGGGLVQAVEIGYASALRHMRDGKYDAELEMWRQELSGQ